MTVPFGCTVPFLMYVLVSLQANQTEEEFFFPPLRVNTVGLLFCVKLPHLSTTRCRFASQGTQTGYSVFEARARVLVDVYTGIIHPLTYLQDYDFRAQMREASMLFGEATTALSRGLDWASRWTPETASVRFRYRSVRHSSRMSPCRYPSGFPIPPVPPSA